MANVTFTYNPTPAPACYPPDMNALAQELTTGGMLVGTIPDTAGGGVTVGSSPPSSALTNKVWFKTDAAGRPLGVYMYYNGNWRKVYTNLGYGEIRLYMGPPNFDSTGRGNVGTDLDGWAICNGQNGTINLDGFFPAGSTNYGASGWTSNADGTGEKVSGGVKQITIDGPNLPGLYTPNFHLGGQWQSGGGGGILMVAPGTPGATQQNFSVYEGETGLPVAGSTPINTTPTFQAMCFIMFVGYQ